MIRHIALFAGIFLASAGVVFANHGPGTSGGGTYTISGETMKPGQFDISMRTDYTKYEDVSVAEAEARALQSGEFDAIKESYIETVSLSYGLVEDIQIGASVGYYYGSNFIDAEADGAGGVESSTADPKGWTDLAINAKWRMVSGQPGNLSLIGGFILPTGTDQQRLANGELIEASSQPGANAFAMQVGLAYSRYLSSRVTVDTSVLYTARTSNEGIAIGDRFDGGLAFAYRLTESVQTFPNYSVVGEFNAVWIGKDTDNGIDNDNTGGWTVYFSPGFRARFNKTFAATIEPSFPFLQNLNGDQIDAEFKIALVLNFTL